MLPPAATAVCRAAKVQEAGVPLPTTRAGEAVSVIVGGVQTAAGKGVRVRERERERASERD